MKFRIILTICLLLVLSTIFTLQDSDHNNKTKFALEGLPQNTSYSRNDSLFIGNPAAFYCNNVMGYDYNIISQEDGSQFGQCIMPDGSKCNQWSFYSSECGKDYSYCAREGLILETKYDGEDPFSMVYSVCKESSGRLVIKISDLINFTTPMRNQDLYKGELSSEALKTIRYEMIASLPSHFDWRDVDGDNWMTPVKNQASCGSCWAFSAIGIVEPYYNFINNNPNLDLDLSEENLVSDCVVDDCSGGIPGRSLKYIRDVGIVDEACMLYTATDSACETMCANPIRYKVEMVVDDYDSLNVDLLKFLLVNHGPVSVALQILSYKVWINDILYCHNLEGNETDHAVVVVGYDDLEQYWIVKNSWGSNYGDGGYFKVGYNQCNIDTGYFAYLPNEIHHNHIPLVSKPGTPFTITPILTGPQDGKILNTIKPTFSWEIDESLDEQFINITMSPDYNLHFLSGGRNFAREKENLGSVTLSENLKEDTTYYWHASYDNGPFSTTESFRTGSGGIILESPILSSPENGAELSNTNVILSWDPVSGADFYEISLIWEWSSIRIESTSNQIDI